MIDVNDIKNLVIVEMLKDEVEILGLAYKGADKEVNILKEDLRRQSDRLIKSQNDNVMNSKILDEVTDELADVKHSYRQLEDFLKTMSAAIAVFGTLGDCNDLRSTIDDAIERHKID